MMTDDFRAVVEALQADERSVLLGLGTEDHTPYLRQVAADAGLPLTSARVAVKRLCALGLAAFGVLFREDDGMPVGSGYWLSSRGQDVREWIEDQVDVQIARAVVAATGTDAGTIADLGTIGSKSGGSLIGHGVE